MGNEKYQVSTLHRSLDIIEAVKQLDECGVTELANHVGLSKSITHNHLNTLEERGYVLKVDGQYRLSFRFLDIGGSMRQGEEIYREGRPEINELANETGELASLATLEQGYCVYLYQARGNDAVNLEVNYIGMYEHLHSTGIGKAMLAYLPPAKRKEIITRHGLPAETEQTITDPEKLSAELDDIRNQGYAVDNEESIPGLRCVGAPIKASNNEVMGAISVSGPISRFKDERLESTLPELVKDTANIVEINTQY